jgi:hypothetical protein
MAQRFDILNTAIEAVDANLSWQVLKLAIFAVGGGNRSDFD